MAAVIRTDCYLQGLAKKICAQGGNKSSGAHGGRRREDGPPAKKTRRNKRRAPSFKGAEGGPHSKKVTPAARNGASAGKMLPALKKDGPLLARSAPIEGKENDLPGSQEVLGSFSAMGLLRQRLRDKIREASGQGRSTELSPAVLEKRQRRKYERERKKRRRKELKAKAKAAEGKEEEAKEGVSSEDGKHATATAGPIVFNKVTVREEGVLSQAEKRREKCKAAKGGLTPLTGKNYRQLLQRLEARKSQIEALKESDEAKARALEARMRWSNALYRAEGVRVRDDEGRLQAALKAKRKREARRQRRWGQRTEQVAQRMQQRQEKRRRNLQRKKEGKVEKRKAKARRKGRVLPGDLEKAGL